jgi:group I intron endonuclease
MDKAGIYKIQNLVTGKVYIGCSYNIEKRWRSHLYMLRKGTHHSNKLQNSWNLYGEGNFKFEILEGVSPSIDRQILFELEEDFINEHDSFYGGYNCRVSSVGIIYEADWLLDFKELSAEVREPLKVVVWSCVSNFTVTLTEGRTTTK